MRQELTPEQAINRLVLSARVVLLDHRVGEDGATCRVCHVAVGDCLPRKEAIDVLQRHGAMDERGNLRPLAAKLVPPRDPDLGPPPR